MTGWSAGSILLLSSRTPPRLVGELCDEAPLQMSPKIQPSGRAPDLAGAALAPASRHSLFGALTAPIGDLVLLLDAAGVVLDVNPAVTPVTGYGIGELVGIPVADLLHPEDHRYWLTSLLGVVQAGGSTHLLEFRIRHKSGSWLPMKALCGSHLMDPAIGAVVVHCRGASETDRLGEELLRTRDLLEDSERRYRTLLNQTPDMILVVDPDGQVVDANSAACALIGYTRAELLQLSIADTYLPEDRQAGMDRLRSLAHGEQRLAERKLLRKDGSIVLVEINLSRLPCGRVQGILRDVTAPREVEEHVRWLTLAMEQSPAAVIMTNTEGVIEYVNPGFTSMSGYTAAEVLGKSPRILQSGLTQAEAYKELWATITAGGTWRGELCNRRKDGRLYWHSASIAPIRNAEGETIHYLGVQQDITPRVEAEAALRERESRLRGLIDSNILGIGFWETSGVISDANDEYLRIVGYTREDLAAGGVNFLTMTPPEYLHLNQRALEQMAEGATVAPWEKELIRKDGRNVPVLVGVAPLNDRRDQGVVFLLDLTERRTLERQLRQAQKMEAIGQLASGVAHDFNNILTAITGYADLLREDLTPGHPGLEDVGEIRTAADRAAGLTRQLLAFSRQQMLEPRILDLNDLVRNMEKMLRRLIGEDVTLEVRLEPSLGSVKADPGQLEQVLMNLAVNSRDAMSEGGSLIITTANVEIDTGYAARHPGMVTGPQVLLSVRDTGEGMDQATKARLFEPFFTTKEKGKGTGLGLSTVYGIVKQSGGFIGVESEPGQGTTMMVYFPRLE